ncbi:hypothetical protein [Xanthomonas maliensis]|uniref:hypothetical protein n=1 Tax=Xanthomonas maliensis TaxID=1321368 RepID=UPI0014792F59|nr:hypothetical protein [Xanthomonas maliensis]
MTMKIIIFLVKIFFGLGGILLFYHKLSLFIIYSNSGAKVATLANNVLVNNHGFYTYITKDQADQLDRLTIWSCIMFGVAVIMDIVQRCALKKSKKEK